MMKFLRALAFVAGVLGMSLPAHAGTPTSVTWGIDRTVSPEPLCVFFGANCEPVGISIDPNSFAVTASFNSLFLPSLPQGIATIGTSGQFGSVSIGVGLAIQTGSLNLQPPTASILGGVKSSSAPTGECATGIDTNGNIIYGTSCGGAISVEDYCATGISGCAGSFTPGVTPSLTLPVTPTNSAGVTVTYDGVSLSQNTFSISGNTISFNAGAIPSYVRVVEVKVGYAPAPGSVAAIDAGGATSVTSAAASNDILTTGGVSGSTGALKDSGSSLTGGVLALLGSNSLTITGSPSNGIWMSAGGSLVTWCPAFNFGCNAASSFTAQDARIMATQGAANDAENGLMVLVTANTGAATVWATSQSYTSGQFTNNLNNSTLYQETVASCTTASSGTGPAGTGTGISDGTCSWNYKGPSYADGKAAINANTIGYAGSDQLWGYTGGTTEETGWSGHFAVAGEISDYNFSGNDFPPFGATQVADLALQASSNGGRITSDLLIQPFCTGTCPNGVSHAGIFISGNNISDESILINAGSTNGIVEGSVTHSGDFILDNSTSVYGAEFVGTYSTGAIDLKGHVISKQEAVGGPHIGTCGTSPGPATGFPFNDFDMAVQVGTGTVTSCAITFAHAYPTTPIVTASTNVSGVVPYVSAISTSGFTISSPSNFGAGQLYIRVTD